MRYLIGVLAIGLISISSCKSPEEKAADKAKADSLVKIEARVKYLAAIDKAEKEMHDSKNMDQRLAVAVMKAYNDFTVTFPNDTLTPEYLFRCAGYAQGSKNYEQAAVYFETILTKHKGYPKYEETAFLAANNYDSYLRDVNHGVDRARQLYQYVIDNYPNTSMANDSKVLITYLDKPESQLFDDVIKKGGK